MAWRSKTTQELPNVRRAWTDEADSTMTRPTTTRAATSAASSTNTAGVRRPAGGRERARGGRPGCDRARGRVRVRDRSAVGTGLLREKLTHGASEVVAPLR